MSDNKHKIILASSSPRRIKILQSIGLEFDTIPSNYEEILDSKEFSYQKIENLAYYKALDVFERIKKNVVNNDKYSLVLSADTVVVIDNQILGKPKNKKEATEMLKNLSGRKHSVVTSVCTINFKNSTKKILSETSYVEFENLTEKTIINYINTYKPFDKAGAYGIQELPDGFVKTVTGSFENIMGLCPKVVKRILE